MMPSTKSHDGARRHSHRPRVGSGALQLDQHQRRTLVVIHRGELFRCDDQGPDIHGLPAAPLLEVLYRMPAMDCLNRVDQTSGSVAIVQWSGSYHRLPGRL
jgi:hypothetical protein